MRKRPEKVQTFRTAWPKDRVGRLHRLPRRPAAGPGPLEIVAAEPAGDVDDLADEIEPRHVARLMRLGVERPRVDAAERHFGGAVAFGAGRLDPPGLEPLGQLASTASFISPTRPGNSAAMTCASRCGSHSRRARRPPRACRAPP